MTPTDREELELAALAMGGRVEWVQVGSAIAARFVREEDQLRSAMLFWNPKHDSGQGAEMGAAVGISVRWLDDKVRCGSHPDLSDSQPYGTDKQAARRAASFAVSVEMGRRIKGQQA